MITISSLDKLANNLTEFNEVERYLSNKIAEEDLNDQEMVSILSNLPSDTMRDYRESPFTPPVLSDLQRAKLIEQKKLMCRKGVYPYSFLITGVSLKKPLYHLKNIFIIH